MTKILLVLAACIMPFTATAESIEECQRLAAENYPLVRRYGLIKQTERLTLSNIAKEWLPKIEAYAQGTYQSAVSELPELLKSILTSQGYDAKGISPLQYRAGINIQQTLYDGGATSAERAVERSRATADETKNAVDIYALRQRVNEIYFGWLLAEEHLRLNGEMIRLLKS
ncbi:MAG: TolC family protein, partial [Prevotella sp.]